MAPLRLISLVALCVSVSISAPSCGSAEPENPQFWTAGVATTDRLWLRDVDGSVVEFDRHGGGGSHLLARGVLSIVRKQGHVLGLRRTTATHSFEADDLETGERLGPTLEFSSDPLALTLDENDLVVLTSTDVFRLQGGRWIRTSLSESLVRGPPAHQVSAASDDAGTIYVAFNAGEWGGGVGAISVSTGRVARVAGGLPATGLTRDGAHRGSVLVSQGLMHMGEEGRILRVCGARTSVVLTEEVPPPPGLPRGAGSGTRSFFGIVAIPNGWVAASPGLLIRSDREHLTRQRLPSYQVLGELRLAALGADVVVVRTDANGGQSLSGSTPLLLKVER